MANLFNQRSFLIIYLQHLTNFSSFPIENQVHYNGTNLEEDSRTLIKIKLSDISQEKNEVDDFQNDEDYLSESESMESPVSDDHSNDSESLKESSGSLFSPDTKIEYNTIKDEEKDLKNDSNDEKLEEKLHQEEEKLNLKDSEAEKTRKYIKQSSRFAKIANIQEDYSARFFTEEEKMKFALESGIKFNDRVILNRIKIKEHMKKVNNTFHSICNFYLILDGTPKTHTTYFA